MVLKIQRNKQGHGFSAFIQLSQGRGAYVLPKWSSAGPISGQHWLNVGNVGQVFCVA